MKVASLDLMNQNRYRHSLMKITMYVSLCVGRSKGKAKIQLQCIPEKKICIPVLLKSYFWFSIFIIKGKTFDYGI